VPPLKIKKLNHDRCTGIDYFNWKNELHELTKKPALFQKRATYENFEYWTIWLVRLSFSISLSFKHTNTHYLKETNWLVTVQKCDASSFVFLTLGWSPLLIANYDIVMGKDFERNCLLKFSLEFVSWGQSLIIDLTKNQTKSFLFSRAITAAVTLRLVATCVFNVHLLYSIRLQSWLKPRKLLWKRNSL